VAWLILTTAGKLYVDLCRDVLRREEKFEATIDELKARVEGGFDLLDRPVGDVAAAGGVLAALPERAASRGPFAGRQVFERHEFSEVAQQPPTHKTIRAA